MSRYLDWLHRDEKPEVQRELTRREKISNWWDYHIWHVVICVAAAALAVHLLWPAFSGVKPDYQVAYVGSTALPEGTAAALPLDAETAGSQALLADIAVARRGFVTEKTTDYPEACEALWAAMTRGAIS